MGHQGLIVGEATPARGPAGGAVMEEAGVGSEAHGLDVVVVGDGAADLHQGDVVSECCVVVLFMDDDLRHASDHFIRI